MSSVSGILVSTICSNLQNAGRYSMSISYHNLSLVLVLCFGTRMRLSYHIMITKSLYCRLISQLELCTASKLIKICTRVQLTWSFSLHMYGWVRLFVFQIARYPFGLTCRAICWQTVTACTVLFANCFRFWTFFRWRWNIMKVFRLLLAFVILSTHDPRNQWLEQACNYFYQLIWKCS